MTNRPDYEAKLSVFRSVFSNAKSDASFFGMIFLSCTVATYGLLSNSIAAVIGAMLIAPLMGPILGGSLAVVTSSKQLLKTAIRAEALGAVIAVTLSTLLTLILPQAELTSEVMARTAPTLIDLAIALASGAAGAYAICVKPESSTLPGVAIATALMPPLCVVGIGLAKQDFSVVTGSLLLFLANTIAITVSAIVVFNLAGFSRHTENGESGEQNGRSNNRNRIIIYPVIMLILISIPLVFIMYRTYNEASTQRIIATSLRESLESIAPNSTLISSSHQENDSRFEIDAAFRTTKIFTPEYIRQMENLLELKLGKSVAISADVVLVQKVDDKASLDTFNDLLPKITETKVVEVIRSSTPEDVIENVVTEKLSLIQDARLEEFTLEYGSSSGAYIVMLRISSPLPLEDGLDEIIGNILEDRLNRRVDVRIEPYSHSE